MNIEFRMTPRELMRKVIELYHVARIPQYYHPNVRRGRSHSVAGRVEDLVAAFLAFNLAVDCEIRVDQPISLVGARAVIYPDIALLVNGELKHIIDVKMDLGWNRRGLPAFCQEKLEMIQKVRGAEATLKDGVTKTQQDIRISSNCSYHILIISGLNISEVTLKESLDKARDYEPVVLTYVLSDGVHPNTYGSEEHELLEKLQIHEDAFARLFDNLSL